MAKKERNRGSVDRARAKRATPPNNERRERVGQVLLRRLLDRGEAETSPMRFMDVPSTMPSMTPVGLRQLAQCPAPRGEAILRRPLRAINPYRAPAQWKSVQPQNVLIAQPSARPVRQSR
jgi:hypothetical protein